MTYEYKTKGVCARRIKIDLEGDVIQKVEFDGGCAGNLTGISSLVEGMTAEAVIRKFKGTPCSFKKTSCPDQLSLALEEALRSREPQA
ncbi:MAG: TIGR03905 family TSCPD domain-containing protein [Oscillospiraceae bacterium]|nr:TIGR03905 family TSCPD domain-containing protein [Oscillospiraceae bacterium]